MFKELRTRLHNWKSLENMIIMFVMILFFMCMFVYAYDRTDRVPATQEDIDELEEKINAVTENPEILLSSDATVKIRRGITMYTIENKECKIVARYDENYKLIGREFTDKSSSNFVAAIISIVLAMILSVPAYLVALLVVSAISLLCMVIKKKKNNH